MLVKMKKEIHQTMTNTKLISTSNLTVAQSDQNSPTAAFKVSKNFKILT